MNVQDLELFRLGGMRGLSKAIVDISGVTPEEMTERARSREPPLFLGENILPSESDEDDQSAEVPSDVGSSLSPNEEEVQEEIEARASATP